MRLDNNMLLAGYNKLDVAILSTSHFRDALEDRVFPLNIVGNAAIEAVSMKIGEKKKFIVLINSKLLSN